MRLHAKVLLVVVPLAVIPLLITGWLAYEQLRSTAVERSSIQMTTLMDQMARNFQMHQDVAKANAKLFADASLMRAYALTEDEEERYVLMLPSLLKLFSSYLRAYPDYTEIRFLLPDGYEDARTTLIPIPNITEEEGDTPFFQELSRFKGDAFVQVSTPPDSHTVSLQVARPVRLIDLTTQDPLNGKPAVRGYLVVTMGLGFMAEQMANSRIGEKGHTLIINENGEILFHQDPSQLGRTISAPLLKAVLKTGKSDQLVPALYQEADSLLATRRLHEGLLLIGILPKEELLKESQRLGSIVGWIVLGTIMLLIFALLISMNVLMVRPLKQLMGAVREIGRGNLAPKIALSTNDELGKLALSFQEMAGNLEKSRVKVERLAYHDSLTGLPNRFQAHQTLRRMISFARRESRRMAVLFLDLDNFKRVNDTLGHQVGDQLLMEMATRLQVVLRAEDVIHQEVSHSAPDVLARLGGDEFIVLLSSVGSSRDAAKVASRILDIMRLPFYFNDNEIYSGCSIGISLFPGDGSDVDDLIKRADAAMYQAKEQGRNNYQFYSASYNLAALEHISLEGRLRRALKNNELVLYYQPLVQARTGKIVGLEALLRWHDPLEGIIPPDRFIPVAEESGLILPLGEWVLREAGRQLSAWHAAGFTDASVSVNVSAIQLQRQDLVTIVEQVLKDNGLRAGQLELEITETALMRIRPEVIGDLNAMRQKGITISLDDFGTGYSSLSLLQELPIGKLKIDKSFVRDMLVDPKDAAIVSAVLFIAKSLGLQSTAEGVETPEQAARLAEEGCDQLQGYLLCRPLPVAEMTEFLKSRKNIELPKPY
ncbi:MULTISPECIES: EAL domain-containing protein [unclassified Marinobacter]|jgi:diguanylate cyclase (GGDEF)-like protein|uniref:bifunctional diguanylate cyclase/phosphodiesterase n=1 Tax=unclassified Marinobacter TaxID=83889 RepID=UPI00200FA8A7|nr:MULTISPECIES: EAL domain-containing protein [unclassified Marinobacter]MCL1477184.1 EAL domain-containing protein [Marinobacter sp.]MCL1480661.1 EAL domain-containing protein [Marinobacter sp.]MCL1484886.1 EAL domain-containing protein [Marinobacter sp.]UQG56456.1 EAL domain-containing protein [Marinobacter sp. M4C]UQG65260.1 EAL domain-containing protein [Marinobacter sp. M2C]